MQPIKFRANFFEVIAERFGLLETIKKYNLQSSLPVTEMDFFISKDNYKIRVIPSKDKIIELDDTLEKFEDDYQDGVSLIHKLKTINDLENYDIIFRADMLYKYLFNLYDDIEIYDYNGSIERFIDLLFNSKALYFDVELKYFKTEGDWMVKNMGYRRRITTHAFDKYVFDKLLHDEYFKYIKKKTCRKKVLKIIKNLNKSKFRKNFRHSILRKFVVLDNIPIFNPNINYVDSEEFYL